MLPTLPSALLLDDGELDEGKARGLFLGLAYHPVLPVG